MLSDVDDLAFRESAFAWLRAQLLIKPNLSRDDLSHFPFQGREYRLLGPYTGIWKPKELSSAIAISTAFVLDESKRPYQDEIGPDGMLRYKWRGTDKDHADNVALRRAMERGDQLIWFIGVGYEGKSTQVYEPKFPVRLVAEEPKECQFVVSIDEDQMYLPDTAEPRIHDIAKKYNEQVVKVRYHQPVFRAAVLQAYQQRCAVCGLPFTKLLEAAHIKPDSQGGSASVTNGIALCKIHHGAFDANLLGITPKYVVKIHGSVLDTTDGPTLQHSLKEMHESPLRQLPAHKVQMPDVDLLAERFQQFEAAS